MRKFLKSLHISRQLLMEFLLVIVSFAIMITISTYFSTNNVKRTIVAYGDESVSTALEVVSATMNEHRHTLDDIAFTIERFWNRNAGISVIEQELEDWSEWIGSSEGRFPGFMGAYGVVNGIFVDGSGWIPPEEYIPETRPWYTRAYENIGEVYYSDPYEDAETGEQVLTISRVLFDRDGKPFGVLAMDLFITSIEGYVENLHLIDVGFGVLLDSTQRFVVHPDKSVIGKRVGLLNDGAGGHAELAALLASGRNVSDFSITIHDGRESVVFFKTLPNGWSVGIVSQKHGYYADVRAMQHALILTGSILAAVLCLVLLYMHVMAARSDIANKLKSSFLANMSHEIRTPMNAIIGMSELLARENLNKRQKTYVDDVLTSAHALLEIINDILDMSKIESGKFALNSVDYDFHAFLDNIVSMFRFMAQNKGIDFKFETEGALPLYLFGDDIRLRQVLTNICSNAIKFTENGYVKLKVTAAGGMLKFEMEDTGMGISKENIGKLFNAFEQMDGTKNRNIKGTGLGLPISKSFVQMMGGRIIVNSVYGEGSTFTVIIPIVVGDEAGVQHKLCAKDDTFCAPESNVLVVDDNEFNLKVAQGLLNLSKIDAKTASSGKQAIGMVQHTNFDLVFMDHMMPEMDGIETTNAIRQLGGKYKNLPIVALTANAVQGAREMFLDNGFDGFISKPIDVAELNKILKEFLPPSKIVGCEVKPEGTVTEEKEADFMSLLDDIDDINAEIGLSRVSNIESMYREALGLFYKSLSAECRNMSAKLNGGDLKGFSIVVHAMKSGLATVGAMKLSEMAAKLETASKENDAEYCNEHFPPLLEKLTALNEQLAKVFPPAADSGNKEKGDEVYLQENLAKALAAADDFDSDAGAAILGELLKYDFGGDINDKLAVALDAVKEFDFDKAAAVLRQLALRL